VIAKLSTKKLWYLKIPSIVINAAIDIIICRRVDFPLSREWFIIKPEVKPIYIVASSKLVKSMLDVA
jgi:hypothetical protein